MFWTNRRVCSFNCHGHNDLGITFALSVACLSIAATLNAQGPELKRIYFGSCIKEQKPMPILARIAEERPDLFIFLGDNIYADTDDIAVMNEKYGKLGANEHFQRIRRTIPVLATWDDHDYGKNDAGVEYTMKVDAQKAFLDFWRDSPQSIRRRREGVYGAYEFGHANRRVQIILLDTRYFRGPLARNKERTVGGPYRPTDDKSVTMLGEAQWKWLRDQLLKPARIRIIASSIQCIASSAGQETWSNIPHERARFFKLIQDTKANGVVLISGDRHWAEISATNDAGYRIYDATSSSLNQPHGRGTPTPNQFRVSKKTWHKENYGSLTINWSEKPSILLQIHAMDGTVQLKQSINLGSLKH